MNMPNIDKKNRYLNLACENVTINSAHKQMMAVAALLNTKYTENKATIHSPIKQIFKNLLVLLKTERYKMHENTVNKP